MTEMDYLVSCLLQVEGARKLNLLWMTQGIITNVDFYTGLSFNPLEYVSFFSFSSTQIILSVESFGFVFYGVSLFILLG